MNSDLTLKLDRARLWLLNNQPFYGSLACHLPDVGANPHGTTACTDGSKIYWSPEFLGTLSDEETRFVLAHETLHCAHQHLWRIPHDETGNHACDHAVNLTLAQIAGLKMPKGGLCDQRFAGKAEEEIYATLANEKKNKPEDKPGPDGKPGKGPSKPDPAGEPGSCGDFCEPAPDGKPGNGPADKPAIGAQTPADKWAQNVIQAAQAAKAAGRGSIPADMLREIERATAQKVDWKRETADWLRESVASRNDWSRANRRMATSPVIYPRRRRDDLGLVIFVRDTSGSIGADVLAQFGELISSCLGDTGARGLLMDCDARIKAEYELEPGAEVPSQAKGGGGTDFSAPFARAAELADAGERIAGMVYLTDLDGSGEPDSADFPVLWLSTSSRVATVGRTVRIDL